MQAILQSVQAHASVKQDIMWMKMGTVSLVSCLNKASLVAFLIIVKVSNEHTDFKSEQVVILDIQWKCLLEYERLIINSLG